MILCRFKSTVHILTQRVFTHLQYHISRVAIIFNYILLKNIISPNSKPTRCRKSVLSEKSTTQLKAIVKLGGTFEVWYKLHTIIHRL